MVEESVVAGAFVFGFLGEFGMCEESKDALAVVAACACAAADAAMDLTEPSSLAAAAA